MSAFEFFFSLFGLVLGLAIATVAGGMADVLRERKRVPLGWLTPLLAAVVLFDLASFWTNGWRTLQGIDVAYGPVNAALSIAVVYFFSATVVFPKSAADWPTLDDYYDGHHRYVIGGMIFANLGLAFVGGFYSETGFLPFLARHLLYWGSLWFYGSLIFLMIFKHRRAQLGGLAMLLTQIVCASVVYAWNA